MVTTPGVLDPADPRARSLQLLLDISKALHGRLKSQRDGTGGKLTVDPPFSFRRERGTDKI